MMRCRHHPCDMRESRRLVTDLVAREPRVLVQLWCSKCGEHIGIQPAIVTPEVAIEIRAAEIAGLARIRHGRWTLKIKHVDGAECAGWVEAAFDSTKVPEQAGEWSGWLAYQIAHHDQVGQ